MSQPYLGEIRMFGGNFAPRSNALCAGQLMSIQQNAALFSLLGTFYGGNGVQTFALPDLRGRLPINQGNGPGLTPRVIGEQAGSETVTLLQTETPMHNHIVNATTDAGNLPGPSNKAIPASPTDGTNPGSLYVVPPGTITPVAMAAQSLPVAGGSQPHQNMMPSLCITFIIALNGIFPSRN
ncbi:tail fiber protein [Sphingomonas oligophenolica]|uniref:Tail fiber protein n=1 Tax=Sphingomonas oligophenolica TaxID=301154 RepID=A0ABU9XZI8_9SPHN